MTTFHQSGIVIPVWACAYRCAISRGKIKTIVDDFIVEEVLPFQPEGIGEHAFLWVEKSGENTEFIARQLARLAGVRQRDVSYAGLKDRHARTKQWFSVWLPGKADPDWKILETESLKILQVVRHLRKLKRGVLSENRFKLTIRDWQGDKSELDRRLFKIKQQGFPNYFGLQRFGHQGQNINTAVALFKGAKIKRDQRGIYFSAVRSYLFNQLLDKRIVSGNWNQAVSGDCFVFDRSNSFFKSDLPDASIVQRLDSKEIHPSGFLFGIGDNDTCNQALEIEESIIKDNQSLADGLIQFKLQMDRRALRVMVKHLEWTFIDDSTLLLSFSLPPGSYATSLLKEFVEF